MSMSHGIWICIFMNKTLHLKCRKFYKSSYMREVRLYIFHFACLTSFLLNAEKMYALKKNRNFPIHG